MWAVSRLRPLLRYIEPESEHSCKQEPCFKSLSLNAAEHQAMQAALKNTVQC